MPSRHYSIIFLLFLVSGFCGLLYEVVWIWLAYASFGILTPVLSVVISVFMLGLSLGAWAGGRWVEGIKARTGTSPLCLYAFTEFLIGVGAFAVPALFLLGKDVLLPAGDMDSFRYMILSVLAIAVSILPWCLFMGFTYPFMMSFGSGPSHPFSRPGPAPLRIF
ncbi:MAG: hypothetical protein JW821_14800 [Deltaproteobacteria bacterium]|nr:hypothetical protein [Deltaproteobacteria bacterium]